ncbi:MAG: hypothetical protein QF819_04630 [Gemmatimonadota bacterium]|jgi:hypothetical protein|nr:hypothetical protein [Gemmatimonadota bacterium]MDP6461948.1 hypothetical protein [Gemmatimonadota bacterium]MDP6528331.1 hypothetical protein [Gemmatimonadota bacterium]MDP6802444.1 hypothetical protein [Gemmatimonadota bacterium]MDP7031000.1 hypothetical protein [Gemmatimonadota bacterium]
MKRFAALSATLLVLILAGGAAAEVHGWTISGRTDDPFANTGPPANGIVYLTLWYACPSDGWSAAEFDLSGSMTVLGFIPNSAFSVLNSGGAENLFLAVGGCPSGPMPAGSIVALDFGGTLCIVPSAANGRNVTVNCDPTNPQAFNNLYTGYASDGSTPCYSVPPPHEVCIPVFAEESRWGTIKSLYR